MTENGKRIERLKKADRLLGVAQWALVGAGLAIVVMILLGLFD